MQWRGSGGHPAPVSSPSMHGIPGLCSRLSVLYVDGLPNHTPLIRPVKTKPDAPLKDSEITPSTLHPLLHGHPLISSSRPPLEDAGKNRGVKEPD